MQDVLAAIDERHLAGDRAGLAPSGVLRADLQRQNPMSENELQLPCGAGLRSGLNEFQTLGQYGTAFNPATKIRE